MKIQQDGTVIIRPEDDSTFRDLRLPLMARFELLAVLLGSEEGLPRWGYEAERLVREVLVRYQGLANAASGRQSTMDTLVEQARRNAVENQRLRTENARLEEENRRLKSEVEGLLWDLSVSVRSVQL